MTKSTLLPVLLLLPLLLGLRSSEDTPQEIQSFIADDLAYLKGLYSHLHQNPELSLYESETAKHMAAELRKAGFEVTEQVGGTGIVGIYKNGEGPTLLIRTDLDALPINEQTELAYASGVTTTTESGVETGVMHACGHDMHMTVWAGTARALVELKNKWQGTLMMIGQPAEEIGAGAKAMLEDGLYERFGVPDFGLDLHVAAQMEAGKIGFCPGFALASVDMVNIKVYGEGGHGAYPHTTIDPVVLASSIIMDLQTIVSRNVKPIDAAVVTVGAIHGGTRGNVISDQVELQLTLRSYKSEVRDLMIKRIEEICHGNAQAFGLSKDKYPSLSYRFNSTPANYNDPELVERVVPAFREAIGADNVIQVEPVMGGEDFSRYGLTPEDVPTFMYNLGTILPERMKKVSMMGGKLPGLHSPFYYPDPEKSIEIGVLTMSNAAIRLLEK